MVDLRKLSVSRDLNRRDWLIGVPGNGQLERSAIVGLRAAKRPDQELCVERLSQGEKLNRKVLLSLEPALVMPNNSCPFRTYQLNPRFAIFLHIEGIRDV